MPESTTVPSADNPDNDAASQLALALGTSLQASQDADTQPADGEGADETVDSLKTKLADAVKAQQNAEKGYRELQSKTDKETARLRNELAERIAKMEGMLTAANTNRGSDRDAENDKAWKDFATSLAAEAQDHPEKAVSVMLNDLLPAMRDDAVRRAESKLSEKLAAVESRLKEVELSPIKQQHKETIDALVQGGIEESEAIRVAQVLAKSNKKIHQPDQVPAPGRTADSGTQAPATPRLRNPAVAPEHATVLDQLWSQLGLSEKQRNAIIAKTAKELSS